MAESAAPGWREVLTVAATVVAVVLGAALITLLLPAQLQRFVFHTPIVIGVLVIGTGFVLWRLVATGKPPS